MDQKTSKKIRKIITAGVIIALGLLLFKFLPISIWGKDILFDASGHISTAIFVLYVLWFFIDQNKPWRTPYLILSALALTVIALQRIIDSAHNDIGLLMGLLLGVVAIGVSQWDKIKGKIEF